MGCASDPPLALTDKESVGLWKDYQAMLEIIIAEKLQDQEKVKEMKKILIFLMVMLEKKCEEEGLGRRPQDVDRVLGQVCFAVYYITMQSGTAWRRGEDITVWDC